MKNYDKNTIVEAINNWYDTKIFDHNKKEYDIKEVISHQKQWRLHKLKGLNMVLEIFNLRTFNAGYEDVLGSLRFFLTFDNFNQDVLKAMRREHFSYNYFTEHDDTYYGENGSNYFERNKDLISDYIPVTIKILTSEDNNLDESTVYLNACDFAAFMLEQSDKAKKHSNFLTEKINRMLTIENEEINSRWEHNPVNDTYRLKD